MRRRSSSWLSRAWSSSEAGLSGKPAPGLAEPNLADLRARKPDAVAQAVRDHASTLLRAALGLGLPLSEAEELVQAVFTTFLEVLPRFEGRSSVRTFLFGILYRKAMEQGRKRGRELAVDPADAVFEGRFNGWGHWSPGPKGPDREADIRELSELIWGCLDQLPAQQRAAFCLKEIDRQAGPEVCNELGVEDTHLRVLLFRARVKLRACLEKRWEGGA